MPPINMEATTGMTVQEQNGPNAPAAVAMRIPTIGRALNAPFMRVANPETRRMTAKGILMRRRGHTCDRFSRMIVPIWARSRKKFLPLGTHVPFLSPGYVSNQRRSERIPRAR